MQDEQILIEVARLDSPQFVWLPHTYNGKQTVCAFKAGEFYGPVPDYLNSRDAIIPVIEKQVEKSFSFRGKFNCELSKETCNRNLSSAVKEPDFIFQMLTPNARQLCIALLKSVGKFRE